MPSFEKIRFKKLQAIFPDQNPSLWRALQFSAFVHLPSDFNSKESAIDSFCRGKNYGAHPLVVSRGRRAAAVGRGPLHGAVLVAGAALTGHGPVEGVVGVVGRVGAASRVARRHRLGDKVLLLAASLLVHLSQLLVLPHGEQHLAAEFEHPRRVLLSLLGDVQQAFHSARLKQRPRIATMC